MNPIVIAAIMTIITELIKNCPEQRAENIKAMLNNPGPLLQIRFEGKLRRQLNISPGEWRQRKDEVMPAIYAEGRAVSIEDAQELVDMSKAA